MARTSAHTNAEGTKRNSGGVSVTVMEVDAWDIIARAVAELPPYLKPGEVTAESTAERFGISKVMAIRLLKAKVKAGELVEVERLNPNGGSHIKAYEKAAPHRE